MDQLEQRESNSSNLSERRTSERGRKEWRKMGVLNGKSATHSKEGGSTNIRRQQREATLKDWGDSKGDRGRYFLAPIREYDAEFDQRVSLNGVERGWTMLRD